MESGDPGAPSPAMLAVAGASRWGQDSAVILHLDLEEQTAQDLPKKGPWWHVMKICVLSEFGGFGGGGLPLHAVLHVAGALEQGQDSALEDSNA